MRIVAVPNLPEEAVSLAVVDGRISQAAEETLLSFGVKLVKTSMHPGVHASVSYHPDIILHHVGSERIVHAPGTDPGLLDILSRYGFTLIEGASVLSAKYPADIAYNAARVGRFVFHNLRYTDPVLTRELEHAGIEPVHVAQGYAKCSISVVDGSSIITSDSGIARAAGEKGLDVLLLEDEKNILLPGMNHGFIGGSSGLIGKGKWSVTGDVQKLASFPVISKFLSSKKIQIISLSNEQVIDLGSILPLMTV